MHSELVEILINLHICKSQFKYLDFLLIKKNLNQLIYNIVLVSGVQQSDSLICKYFFFFSLYY